MSLSQIVLKRKLCLPRPYSFSILISSDSASFFNGMAQRRTNSKRNSTHSMNSNGAYVNPGKPIGVPAEGIHSTTPLLLRPCKRTVSWKQLPEWLRDNAYITDGYRPQLNSYIACTKSLFYLHNEFGTFLPYLEISRASVSNLSIRFSKYMVARNWLCSFQLPWRSCVMEDGIRAYCWNKNYLGRYILLYLYCRSVVLPWFEQ